MSSTKLCPICEEGQYTEHGEYIDIKYRAADLRVYSLYSTCDTCLSDFATSEQANANKQASIQAKTARDKFIHMSLN